MSAFDVISCARVAGMDASARHPARASTPSRHVPKIFMCNPPRSRPVALGNTTAQEAGSVECFCHFWSSSELRPSRIEEAWRRTRLASMMAGAMSDTPVIIAGAGIGGLATALTLHQIGVPCSVLESVREMRPLGVGINLQPNAVRELYELGITEVELEEIGIAAREWALVGLNGGEIYSEPRGRLAGYRWPQYAVHRGQLQRLLYQKVIDRIGPRAVHLDARVTGYRRSSDGQVVVLVSHADGSSSELSGRLLIGADGIHSAVRAQMHPSQPPIHWGGKMMWRGVTRAAPIRTGASFIGLGTHRHRIVLYPISQPDRRTGLALINWVAEVTLDDADDRRLSGWFRQVPCSEFLHHFAQWRWNWLDVPALIEGAESAFENPMIDRDPVPSWVEGPVALLGDAAHAMYPTGSNG